MAVGKVAAEKTAAPVRLPLDGSIGGSYGAAAYIPLQADAAGIVRSEVCPGLWLAVPALLNGQLAPVLATLHRGLATPGHQTFVEHWPHLRRQHEQT